VYFLQVFHYLQDTGQYFLTSFITMAPYYCSYFYSVESVESSLKRVLSVKNETGLFNFFYIFSFSPLSIL